MIFVKAEPDDNYFLRFVSQGGRWEMGFCQMIYGVRVRLGRAGFSYVNLDYCAGADPEHQEQLLRTVMMIVLNAAEDISEGDLQNLFPRCVRKPVMLDPCWEELKKRAVAALSAAGARSAKTWNAAPP